MSEHFRFSEQFVWRYVGSISNFKEGCTHSRAIDRSFSICKVEMSELEEGVDASEREYHYLLFPQYSEIALLS